VTVVKHIKKLQFKIDLRVIEAIIWRNCLFSIWRRKREKERQKETKSWRTRK